MRIGRKKMSIKWRRRYEKTGYQYLYKDEWLTAAQLLKLKECVVNKTTLLARLASAVKNPTRGNSMDHILTHPARPITFESTVTNLDWHNKMLLLWRIGSLSHLAKPCSCKEYKNELN